MKKYLIVFLILISGYSQAQDYFKIDSLKQYLSVNEPASNQLNTLDEIFWHFLYYENDSALYYAQESENISQNLADSLKFLSFFNLASYYRVVGEHELSFHYFDIITELEVTEEQELKNLTVSNFNIGLLMLDQSLLDSAIVYFNESLQLIKKKENINIHSRLLINMGNAYYYKGEPQKSIDYYQQALAFNQKNYNDFGIAQTSGILGILYHDAGENEKALEAYQISADILYKMEKWSDYSSCLYDMGTIYETMGNTPKALQFYYDALKIRQDNNEKVVGFIYNSLAGIYSKQGETKKAEENYLLALKISKETNRPRNTISVLSSLAAFYLDQKKDSMAYAYLMQEDSLINVFQEDELLAYFSLQFGNYYRQQGQLDKAKDYFQETEKLFLQLEFQLPLLQVRFKLAELLLEQGKRKESKKLLLAILIDALELSQKQEISKIYKLLSEIHKLDSNYQQAYSYFEAHKAYNDSLFEDQNIKALTEVEMQYHFDLETKQKELEQEKKDAILQSKMEKQKLQNIYLSLAAILLIIIILFAYRAYLIKKKSNKNLREKNILIENQKKEIEFKNQEITSSIKYAQRIQLAILPETKELASKVADYFVLFKPKDIVSGDFYWIRNLGNKIIVAAADCTGHGVPGGFMSMLGISFLNELIEKNKLPIKASELLDELRGKVKQTLQGEKDGMDIALIVLDFDEKSVSYSGAYNPLVLIRNNELQLIKADRQPIGDYSKEKPFTLHRLPMEKGDQYYLYSDGFADQFGGEKGKKYMSKRFHKYLLQNAHLPMEFQQSELDKEFENWKKSQEQMDDVLVVGIKI